VPRTIPHVASTRWLTPEQQRAWRAYLESTKILFDALDRQLQREADMPHAYFEVLVRLSEAPNRSLRMSQLAALTLSSRSRLSHAVARLEERGWVTRTRSETDRRGQIATLTDAGFAVLEAAAPGHVETVRGCVIDGLTEEQLQQLTVIGETIIRRVEASDFAEPQSVGGGE
jgi:DNA-binding MarR family transcriptional regulator